MKCGLFKDPRDKYGHIGSGNGIRIRGFGGRGCGAELGDHVTSLKTYCSATPQKQPVATRAGNQQILKWCMSYITASTYLLVCELSKVKGKQDHTTCYRQVHLCIIQNWEHPNILCSPYKTAGHLNTDIPIKHHSLIELCIDKRTIQRILWIYCFELSFESFCNIACMPRAHHSKIETSRHDALKENK